ncbi:lipoprotein [Variovorax sp. J31P179]|uniref:LPS translocon maturation chaperone LptM n=1 Tax=Variovorax sp. J31P179 TaxID=3053508 RepID=UPI002578833C|nr:lipoprotein [Variovorax sp. J31P179]MDM0083824.1 lipoprotein [Variovorax sp. J31P179]HET7837978.1 lipoprotein [Variovorax sp.]
MSAFGLALVGVGLAACGQKGSLYLPTDPLAKERTTLPGLLLPTPPASAAGDAPAKPPAAASSAPAGASQ